MKSWMILVLPIVLMGCHSITPDAGEEAVLVRKPWIFGHGGVDSDPVKTGRRYAALSTNAIIVDVRPVQYKAHAEDLMSLDGVPLDFDCVIRLKVTDSVKLIEKFGVNWYPMNIESEFMNRLRQAVRKHGMNEVAINTKAIEDIDAEVSEAMISHVAAAGIPVELIQVTVGRANPPDSIKDQRIATATQQQRQLTEHERKLAEDVRKAAEESRAAADNAYREALHLSPEQFLQMETINMQKDVCAKGNCTFVAGVPGLVAIGGK